MSVDFKSASFSFFQIFPDEFIKLGLIEESIGLARCGFHAQVLRQRAANKCMLCLPSLTLSRFSQI